MLRDGDLVEVDPLSGSARRELPGARGEVEGIYTLHSELATLPGLVPVSAGGKLGSPSLLPGLVEKLLALGDERPEPYVQSPQSVAVHLVAADGVAVAAVTRGGSARSTAEPPARAAAELAAGRLARRGVHPPERVVSDPEGFLGMLDTEVVWA